MKSKKDIKSYTRGQKIFWISLAALLSAGLICLVAWFVITVFMKPTSPAEEVSNPIISQLRAAGGVERCRAVSTGVNNIDSKSVGLTTYYEVPLQREQTVEKVVAIAENDGFTLIHANSENRPESLSVADIYLSDWYFDVTSKKSDYKDLYDGPIQVKVAFYNDMNEDIRCGGTLNAVHVTGSDRQTVVRLEVKLPDHK
jgi:hypothetical protein